MDWGIERGFLLSLSDAKAVIIDGGDLPFSTTTIGSVADAIVGVLTHPDETKNRSVRIHDTVLSQNQLLSLAKKAAPGKSWEAVPVKLDDLLAAANARFAKGLYDMETFAPYLARATLAPGYGGKFETTDNALLGVKGVSEDDIVDMFKKVFNKD